jgi:predicted nuclease with TOPRIM domain
LDQLRDDDDNCQDMQHELQEKLKQLEKENSNLRRTLGKEQNTVCALREQEELEDK